MNRTAFIFAAGMVSLWATVSVAQTAEAFEKAYASGDWERAATAGARWAENEPQNAGAAYNTACAFALAGEAEAALDWLRRSGSAGFAGTRSIEEDPDLASARAHPKFEQAVAGIRANRARLFEAFRGEAERSEILTIVPRGSADGPRPLFVVLHGHGGRPEADAERYRKVAKELGAIIAAPSAIRPGPGGQGFSWMFRDESEWWVLRAIEKISARYAVDPARVVLAGFSQGANLALSVGLKHPERFAGVLAVAGHYEPHLMPTPAGRAPRVYLMIGEDDEFAATFSEAEENLSAGGIVVRLRTVPGLGHAYPTRATRELRQALEFLLAAESERPTVD